MARYGRTIIAIAVIVIAVGLILGFQNISIGDFQRGSDTPLGLSLGLDLQGGSHLVYQADLRDPDSGERVEVTEDQMESLQRTIERRVNNSGLGEPIIQLLGTDRLLIQLPGVEDRDRAVAIIGETARLEFKRREFNIPRDVDEITDADVLGAAIGLLPVSEESEPESAGEEEAPQTDTAPDPLADQVPIKLIVKFSDSGAAAMQTILDRLNQSFSESLIAVQLGERGFIPPDTLEILIEGEIQQRFAASAISAERIDDSNSFAFSVPFEPGTSAQPSLEVAQERLGSSPTLSFTEILGYADEDTGLTGDDLARAFPGQHSASGRPIVNLEFNDEGTRIFGELTTDIILKGETGGQRDQIAIFLDDQELISPTVNAPITAGTAIIEGGADFTIERVRDLSLLLESGRLPIPIALIQERDVDAILGADSLAKSVVAGLVGLALVLLFMTMYYRLPGLVASIALVIYASLVLAIFKILPVTLTLSGVAAVILSIGMAVDANILIFERMKDELRAGRTLLMSINIGFDRAWPAIRDGNVSTLITCAILFWFADQLGASIVQGFAVTLAIGVVVSMFTAITISRSLLRFVATARGVRSVRLWLPSGGSELAHSIGD